MTDYVFPPQAVPSLPISGSDARFPVHRIYCIGRNYADHAREMGFAPDPDALFFFLKPADAVLEPGRPFPYPSGSSNVHHEVELVVALGAGGRDLTRDEANDIVFGYGVGLDMTRRDLQISARDRGRPWDAGKAVDASAPCSALVPKENAEGVTEARIWLTVNDVIRQDSHLSDLIFDVPHVVAYLSHLYELQAGDLIFTGTPAGVGPVVPGDRIDCAVEGVAGLSVEVC